MPALTTTTIKRSNAEIQAEQEELARQYEKYVEEYNSKRVAEERRVVDAKREDGVDVAAAIQYEQEKRAREEEQELASRFPTTEGVDEQVVELSANDDHDAIKAAAESSKELVAKADDAYIPLDFRDQETASYENLRDRDRHDVVASKVATKSGAELEKESLEAAEAGDEDEAIALQKASDAQTAPTGVLSSEGDEEAEDDADKVGAKSKRARKS